MTTELLTRARQIALTAAHQNGTVTADDIPQDIREKLGPSAGSVFRTNDFEFTGTRVNSRLVSNHSRELKVWELTPKGKKKAEKEASNVAGHSQQAEARVQRKPAPEASPQHIPEPAALPSWLR